jgi:hypothetical protein
MIAQSNLSIEEWHWNTIINQLYHTSIQEGFAMLYGIAISSNFVFVARNEQILKST